MAGGRREARPPPVLVSNVVTGVLTEHKAKYRYLLSLVLENRRRKVRLLTSLLVMEKMKAALSS